MPWFSVVVKIEGPEIRDLDFLLGFKKKKKKTKKNNNQPKTKRIILYINLQYNTIQQVF